jgi:regulator of RNase E activity RraA
MTEIVLPKDLLALLQTVDTPTVCNAIEVVQGKRGFNRFTKGTMQHSNPGQAPMVGFARTARIAGLIETTEAPEIIRERRLDYFRSMASGPRPSVAVVEDLDFPECIAGWWGEVHSNVHKGLGLNGALTNGVMRDLDVMAEGFAVLSGSIGPSHGHVYVVDIGTPVNIFGIVVEQGELIHADRHGALVIPPEVIPELKRGIETVFSNEAIIIGPSKKDDFNIEKLEEAWAEFEAVRT